MNDRARPAILAVDDTNESLALLVQVLTAAGYSVRPADSGELALAAAAANPPDLILLDVRMNGVDGLEVCRRLKARKETVHIPIILISAFADAKEWVEGLRLGAADFVTKPFQTEELLTRVKTHLALSRAHVSLEQQTAVLRQANEQLQSEIAERRHAEESLREKNIALEAALAKVRVLSGLLPICASCKKIRDEKGYWSAVESYLGKHSEATFTHGLCPECRAKHYPSR